MNELESLKDMTIGCLLDVNPHDIKNKIAHKSLLNIQRYAKLILKAIPQTKFVGITLPTSSSSSDIDKVVTAAPDLLGDVTTPDLLGAIEDTASLLGDIEGTPNLLGDVSTANLLGDVSTPSLLGDVDTANLLGDVNKDGVVDEADLSIVHKGYAKTKKARKTKTKKK